MAIALKSYYRVSSSEKSSPVILKFRRLKSSTVAKRLPRICTKTVSITIRMVIACNALSNVIRWTASGVFHQTLTRDVCIQ
ncbi:Uncharacterised protein [Vibrio cholerae]|nr:Uncharacterised protein [Vibrio cholerae]